MQGYTRSPRLVKTRNSDIRSRAPLIDCEEDRALRAVLVGTLRDAGGRSQMTE
jgi:hypothetical protein